MLSETLLVLVLIVCSNLCMAFEVAYAKCNEAISLTCTLNSNLADIEWYHQKIGSTQTVYLDGSILLAFRERFSVSCNERTCELKISRVNSTDAGKYTCKHHKETNFVELIVFEVYPSDESCSVPEEYNKTIIGKNACSIAPATVPISCKMKYYGNKVPEMVWTDDYKKITLDSKKNETNDVINSTVQVIAESTTKITCTIQFSSPTITSNIYWTKDITVIDLFNSYTKDITNCSSGDQICEIRENCRRPQSSSSPSSQWTFPNGTSINSSKTLVLKGLESGYYECNNVCDIRGQNCVIHQRTITHVCSTDSETEAPHAENIPGFVIGITVTVVAVAVGATVAAVFFILRKHRNNKVTKEKADETANGHLTSLTKDATPGKNVESDPLNA